jgi:flagellar basal-body rod protein FlgB
MSLTNTPQLHLLERYLDLTAERQGLLSANIANIDTPGYRTRDIDFHGELSRAMDSEETGRTEPMVREVSGLIARPDGNNVSVDREGLLLSQVQLQFDAASELVKEQFKILNMAIDKGGA